MTQRRKRGAYTATEVARRAGLSRPYIYYLLKRGLLKPVGPAWSRAEFDEDALHLATILAGLQRRRIGPDAAVRAVDAALEDYRNRTSKGRIQPLQDEMAALTDEVWGFLSKAAAAGSVRDIEPDLLTLARRYQALTQRMDRETDRLASPPRDDPAWRRLQELFGSAQLRDEFVVLLKKTRGLGAATSVRRRGS